MNRLGNVKVAILGGYRSLLIQKDITLRVNQILTGLGLAGIQVCRLLHVIEHQDRLASLHSLALGRQDLHHSPVNLRAQCHITGGAELADYLNRGAEISLTDGLELHYQRWPGGLLGGTPPCAQQAEKGAHRNRSVHIY